MEEKEACEYNVINIVIKCTSARSYTSKYGRVDKRIGKIFLLLISNLCNAFIKAINSTDSVC